MPTWVLLLLLGCVEGGASGILELAGEEPTIIFHSTETRPCSLNTSKTGGDSAIITSDCELATPSLNTSELSTRLSELEDRLARMETSTPTVSRGSATYLAHDGKGGDPIFLGRASTEVVLHVTLSDAGCLSGGAVHYEIVGGYWPGKHGLPKARTLGDADSYPTLHPKVTFKYMKAEPSNTHYFLYVLMGDWGACGGTDSAKETHSLYWTIEPVPADRPGAYGKPGLYPDESYNASAYLTMEIEDMAKEFGSQLVHTGSATYLAHDGNDGDPIFLGRASANVILHVTLSDTGCNSGGAVHYEIVGGYSPGKHGLLKAKTLGDSASYPALDEKITFKYKKAEPSNNHYFLFVLMGDWGNCGNPKLTHTINWAVVPVPATVDGAYSAPKDNPNEVYDEKTYISATTEMYSPKS